MNISPEANGIIKAIERYVEATSKIEYVFTIDEQLKLQRIIEILQNQINILIDYEIKRERD